MISKSFYTQNNLSKLFGYGLQHYTIKEATTIISSYEYVVEAGDTMYTLAKRLFNGSEQYWTIISDLNYTRRPDDLVIGETIKLPILVLDDTRFNKVNYDQTPSATTKI
jgi:hypothetical protein